MPLRIVSLVPSLTDMVCELGLRDSLVGCTKFCIKPTGLRRTAAMVGGTKDPDLEAIAGLRPTHILVNEEENKPEHIAACRELAATITSFPKTPRDVPGLLRECGARLGVSAAAERFAREIEAALERVNGAVDDARKSGTWTSRKFLYYIWREPYMVVASDTYISAMLELVGFVNVAPPTPRYPTVTVDEAAACGPDLVFLSTEPYPFRIRDEDRLKVEWPSAPEILKADGQLFSWYGTTLVEALREMELWVKGESQKLVTPFGH